MIEQRETLSYPTGCARIMLLRLPHVYDAKRLSMPPQQALGQFGRQCSFASTCIHLHSRVFHPLKSERDIE
jgi:hypothetical protein